MPDSSRTKLIAGLLILTISSIGAISISGLLTTSKTLSSQGTINNSLTLGVYSDSGCTTLVNSLAWGSLDAGSVITRTVYVKNLGTVSSTLQCTFTNWTPADAPNHITLTWNRENVMLAPGASISATFTITVLGNIHDVTTFSVDVNINATQS